MDEAKVRADKKQKPKKEVETTPFFQEMVDHIDRVWTSKKRAKFHWEPRFFRELKALSRTYSPFGVMALFDLFMSLEDEWVRSTGYSFHAFISSLPKLLDNRNWKSLRDMYETKFDPPHIDSELEKIIPGIVKPANQLKKESPHENQIA